jgi:prepilin-type N-terminal cleavage/methylation domain-containing protein
MVKRPGFTLVEVVVSITLLSVAVLAFAASGALAAGLLRTAEREDAATRLAASLLDSLALVPDPGAGLMVQGAMAASWSGTRSGSIALSISYVDAGQPRLLRWSGYSLADLPASVGTPREEP